MRGGIDWVMARHLNGEMASSLNGDTAACPHDMTVWPVVCMHGGVAVGNKMNRIK